MIMKSDTLKKEANVDFCNVLIEFYKFCVTVFTMKYKVENWKELMEANSLNKIEIIDHLDGFEEDKRLIEIVEEDLIFDDYENEELIRCLCEMIENDNPAIKSISFEKIEDDIFEITEIRRDGR